MEVLNWFPQYCLYAHYVCRHEKDSTWTSAIIWHTTTWSWGRKETKQCWPIQFVDGRPSTIQGEQFPHRMEIGGRKSEVGSQKWEVGSKKWEVGGQKSNYAALSLNSQKSEIRSSNCVWSEVWIMKSWVWNLKSEVWSRKSEVRSRKTLLGFRSFSFRAKSPQRRRARRNVFAGYHEFNQNQRARTIPFFFKSLVRHSVTYDIHVHLHATTVNNLQTWGNQFFVTVKNLTFFLVS